MKMLEEGPAHYVYQVDIKGSTEAEKYLEADLNVTARALHGIRQNEKRV